MKPRDPAPTPVPERLLYVYGFAEAVAANRGRLPHEGIEEGCPVEWMHGGGVAAIVSRVPAGHYDQTPLATHLEDAAWVVERARRHGEVLHGSAVHGCVVPCRFGVLFRDDAGVQRMLDRHGRALRRTLRRLRGKEEWAVKAHVAPAVSPPIPTRVPLPGGAGEGASYLLARADEHRRGRDAAERAPARGDAILADLEAKADVVLPLPPRDLGAPGVRGLFLSLACLVPRRRARAFVACLRRLAAREEAHDVVLTWSGPLPPYSFVGEAFPVADPPAPPLPSSIAGPRRARRG